MPAWGPRGIGWVVDWGVLGQLVWFEIPTLDNCGSEILLARGSIEFAAWGLGIKDWPLGRIFMALFYLSSQMVEV